MARVVKLVDTGDLKSLRCHSGNCRLDGMMMGTDCGATMSDTRSAFEAWAKWRVPLDRSEEDESRYIFADIYWRAWQAACEACAKACEANAQHDYANNGDGLPRVAMGNRCDDCAADCRDLAS